MGFLYDEWKVRNSKTSSEKQAANVEFVLKNLDNLIPVVTKIIFPVGSIYMSVSDNNPANWISGTFWVPWGSGRVPVGINPSETEFNVVEKTGGEKTHTLTVDEMPNHGHSGTTSETGNHAHSISNYGSGGSDSSYGAQIASWKRGGGGTSSGGNHGHTFTTNARGADKPHNNLQPYITCYMWKRIA